MDLELLQSISVAVGQVRTVETVLKMIVDGLVEQAGFAPGVPGRRNHCAFTVRALGYGITRSGELPTGRRATSRRFSEIQVARYLRQLRRGARRECQRKRS